MAEGGSQPSQAHWRGIWAGNPDEDLSWTQPRPGVSLRLLHALQLPPTARVLDVGGGASVLVDHLLDEGFQDVAVLDIAPEALERARTRLGPERAARVRWIMCDVTAPGAPLPPGLDVWHDRAVFHFLTEAPARAAYRAAVERSLRPGGHVLVATFAPDGPERCSGLSVRRYDAGGLARELGPGFTLVAQERETHRTPWGDEQRFQWAVLRRAA